MTLVSISFPDLLPDVLTDVQFISRTAVLPDYCIHPHVLKMLLGYINVTRQQPQAIIYQQSIL